jgi:hypothetical protein
MAEVSYIHCCPEDHEPIPNLEGMPFYVITGNPGEDVCHVIVDPKDSLHIYAQVRDRDGKYHTRRGYLVDFV